MATLQSDNMSFGSNSPPLLGHSKVVAVHREVSQSSSNLRFHIVSRAYADTGTLALYFTKAKQGVIADTDHIAAGIVADYDIHDRLVSLDICSAPKATPCHFYSTAEEVDGKQPLAVNWHYSAESDQLTVLLGMWDMDVVASSVETDNPNITLGRDAAGKLCAVFIANPACNTFTAA